MNINEINRIGATNPYRKHSNMGNSASIDNKGKKDQVQISEEAKRLLESQEIDPARAKKINDLKNAVSTGTYKVDTNVIAEKLLPYLGVE